MLRAIALACWPGRRRFHAVTPPPARMDASTVWPLPIRTQPLPKLPGVLDAPRRADLFVAAEDHQRGKAVLVRPLGVRQAVLDRVLRRQEGDDALARHVGAEIDDEMPQVVLFLRPDRAIGEKNERPLARQTPDGVIRIDPGVHAFAGRELGARRAQLCAKYGRSRSQRREEVLNHAL